MSGSHHEQAPHGSLGSYVIGFILSIVLTIIPLVLVLNHLLAIKWLVASILLLAVAQFAVQLFMFMHIREGEGPKYNVWALALGIFVVVTIVAASIWIMSFNSQVQ